MCILLCSFPRNSIKSREIMAFTDNRFEVLVISLHATTGSIWCCAKSRTCITEWLAPNWLKSFKQLYTWEKKSCCCTQTLISLNQIVRVQSHHVIFKRIKLETTACNCKEMEMEMFKPLTGAQTSLHTATLPPSWSKFSKQYILLQKMWPSHYSIAASNSSYKSLNYWVNSSHIFSF